MLAVTVVNSGVANLRSVVNTLRHLGADCIIADSPAALNHAGRVILPGVGAFAAGMATLRSSGFVEPLLACARAGIPLLGICLGMQMLFEASDEMGPHEGLGLMPGRVVRFPVAGPKVPHIGWNQLHHMGQSPLLQGIPSGSYAYFVHSFYAQAAPDHILAHTDYGLSFPAVVGSGSVFGAQFHPEKSQTTGLRVLRNFLEIKT